MDNKIIDDVGKFMEMDEKELDELLLDEKYNKALLRELVRRSLKCANEYKGALDYVKTKRNETERILSVYEEMENGGGK